MITPKSHEFLEGYIFNVVESIILKAIKNKTPEFCKVVTIPKSWFGLRATASVFVVLPEHEQSKLRLELKELFNQLNNSHVEYEYNIDFHPNQQYIDVFITGHLVEPVKEMTIEEIEKELGYKIKVIGDKT